METFYFGRSPRLFGAYHPPRNGRERDAGVVVCPPFGSESVRAHRAMLLLAQRLAGAGYHVLRFDYSACGDSEWDGERQSVDRWRKDTQAAVGELAGGTGAGALSLVGLRFGALLALGHAAAHPGAVARLVLWNPVLDGAGHLDDLRRRHNTWRQASFAKRRTRGVGSEDLLGFPVPPGLAVELETASLPELPVAPAGGALVVADEDVPDAPLAARSLEATGTPTEIVRLAGHGFWRKEGDMLDQALVPAGQIDHIVDWFEGAPA